MIEKATDWEKPRDVPMNERQRPVINKLLEGFEGMLTTSKWAVDEELTGYGRSGVSGSSSNAASWFALPQAGGAPATHWRSSHERARGRWKEAMARQPLFSHLPSQGLR